MTGAYGDPPAGGAYASGSPADPYPPAVGPASAYPAGGPYAASGVESPPDVADTSVGDLIGNVTRDLSTLMRQELALAQAEVKQEVSKTAKGAGAMSGAGVAGYFVLLFLSIALWAGLSNVMDAGWAGLIVAVLWAAIGGALFVIGRSKLREVHPKPERTVETLSNVPDALKGQRGGTR
jgi:hypothetical protein